MCMYLYTYVCIHKETKHEQLRKSIYKYIQQTEHYMGFQHKASWLPQEQQPPQQPPQQLPAAAPVEAVRCPPKPGLRGLRDHINITRIPRSNSYDNNKSNKNMMTMIVMNRRMPQSGSKAQDTRVWEAVVGRILVCMRPLNHFLQGCLLSRPSKDPSPRG